MWNCVVDVERVSLSSIVRPRLTRMYCHIANEVLFIGMEAVITSNDPPNVNVISLYLSGKEIKEIFS